MPPKFNRGLDEQMLEGGVGGMGGAATPYKASGKKAFDPDKDAMNTIATAFGIPLAVSGVGVGIKKINDQQNKYDEVREKAAPKEKTPTERAKEDAKEMKLQERTNKAAENASKNMAKGGMTASRRADGCATKGKTRGRYL